MLKKKIGDKLAERAAALRKKAGKSQPQWDDLEAWCRQTTATLAVHTTKLNTLLLTVKPTNDVSEELEAAINKNAALAHRVDAQVPDNKRK